MKKLSKKIIAAVALGGMIFCGGMFYQPTSFAANTTVKVKVNVKQQGSINWSKGKDADITAVGISPKDNRGLAMSREAAIMAAQRNLVGIVQGMSINSETSMRDLIIQSDVVNRKISGMMRGAEIVEEEAAAEGGYYVKMRVPIYGVSGIAAAVVPEIKSDIPKAFAKVDKPSVSQETIQTVENANYTGLVVDTSGLGTEETFSPVIYDTEGRAIYGIDNLNPDAVIENGMVSYSETVDDEIAKSRAGDNPLTVKAVEMRGGENSTNKVNAVVSVEDADKILLANEQTQILENCAVVFEE